MFCLVPLLTVLILLQHHEHKFYETAQVAHQFYLKSFDRVFHIGCIAIDKVKGSAIFDNWDTPEIAFKEAKKEFERRGLYEHIMGKRI